MMHMLLALFLCSSPGWPFLDQNSNGCFDLGDIVLPYPQMLRTLDETGRGHVDIACPVGWGYTVPADAPESNPFFPAETSFLIVCPEGTVQTASWSGFFKEHNEHTSLSIWALDILFHGQTHTVLGGGAEEIHLIAGGDIRGDVTEIRLHDKRADQMIALQAGRQIVFAAGSLISAINGQIVLDAPILSLAGVTLRAAQVVYGN